MHPAIEILERMDDRWTFVARPERCRNYELFSLLAGVRGPHNAWVKPRGLPEKMDWKTYDHEDEMRGVVTGDHTASWFTLREARTFVMPDNAEEWTREQWRRWLRTMEFFATLYRTDGNHVRAVFNFDS